MFKINLFLFVFFVYVLVINTSDAQNKEVESLQSLDGKKASMAYKDYEFLTRGIKWVSDNKYQPREVQ